MKHFDFVVEFSNGSSIERTVAAENEKQAHRAVWVVLTEAQKDCIASIELVEERDTITNEELAEAVAARIGKGTTREWAKVICNVARENGVSIARVESAYDAWYRNGLVDRGIDP